MTTEHTAIENTAIENTTIENTATAERNTTETSGLILLVLAAGMGSRYGGLKQTDSFGPSGETLLEYTVFDALRAGFTRVVFVVRDEFASEFDMMVAAKFRPFVDVRISIQRLEDLPAGVDIPAGRVKPFGTVQAVLAAREHLDQPFAIVNADDLYGQDALEVLAAGLASLPGDGSEAVLVSYPLGSTLSGFGAVTRGVCAVDEAGWLTGIEEIPGLRHGAGCAIDAQEHVYPMGTPVAVNLMGFVPAELEVFTELFEEFCRTADLASAELPVSTALGTLLTDGLLQVRVVPSAGAWCGVTVREDKPLVEVHVAELVRDGVYPASLWSEQPITTGA
jgi:hypothetical protein